MTMTLMEDSVFPRRWEPEECPSANLALGVVDFSRCNLELSRSWKELLEGGTELKAGFEELGAAEDVEAEARTRQRHHETTGGGGGGKFIKQKKKKKKKKRKRKEKEILLFVCDLEKQNNYRYSWWRKQSTHRTSLKWPMLRVRTRERMTMSFCCPWYSSTVAMRCGKPKRGLWAQRLDTTFLSRDFCPL